MLLHPPKWLLLTERGYRNETAQAMLGMQAVFQTPYLATSGCTSSATNSRQLVHFVARIETALSTEQNRKQGIVAFQVRNVELMSMTCVAIIITVDETHVQFRQATAHAFARKILGRARQVEQILTPRCQTNLCASLGFLARASARSTLARGGRGKRSKAVPINFVTLVMRPAPMRMSR